MNREEALSIWAPVESPWSRWTKAVLFGFMPEEIPDVPASASDSRRVPSDPGTALLVELAGARGVESGAALARSGYRPVPLYNACPFPINVFSVPNFSSVVEVVPIMRALERETSTLQGLALPPSAPPAFLLDANRRRPASRPEVGWYDNRSVVRPSDVPTATFLKERGIRQVTVVQAEPSLQSDLRTVLLAWQEGGLTISRQVLAEPWNPQVFTVIKPSLLRAWWDERWLRLGYPLNDRGSFGEFMHSAYGSGGSGG